MEQCSLEYDVEKGSSIDPHIDDCWIWGERIPTLSMLSDSVLTMNKYTGSRYNLEDTKTYQRIVPRTFESDKVEDCILRIPMPRRSLLILYGDLRYDWEHSILRQDVDGRRVCLTYRELTPTFREGGESKLLGDEILEKARIFFQVS